MLTTSTLASGRSVKRTRTQLTSRARRSKRETILARDGSTCWICRHPLVADAPAHSPLRTTLDHVVEVTQGGSNRNENLRLAHAVCNNTRGRVYAALHLGQTIKPANAGGPEWRAWCHATYGEWAGEYDHEEQD
jgi:5-methylcytosine-specific restriction endonuclease McrA